MGRREIDILKLFKGYESIASFHDVFEDEFFLHIVMELCTGGELFTKIVQKVKEYGVGYASEEDACAETLYGV